MYPVSFNALLLPQYCQKCSPGNLIVANFRIFFSFDKDTLLDAAFQCVLSLVEIPKSIH